MSGDDWDAYEKAIEPTTSFNWEPPVFDRKKSQHDAAMVGTSGFERVEGDQYWTEPWVTIALLNRVEFRGVIWEPACGRGDMANVLADSGYNVTVSDIAGDALGCKGAAKIDFRTAMPPAFDPLFSIVTNPPYQHASSFIRQALDLTSHAGGMVAMLLRNEFDCAASRRGLFEGMTFAAKLVLTKRPKWADVHTASPRHNFAWYIWDHQHSGSARIEWLP
jgi:hypothetical protein